MSFNDEIGPGDAQTPKLMVSIREVCGIFAKWACQQSPYGVPKDLAEATLYFKDQLFLAFGLYIEYNGDWIVIPHNAQVDVNSQWLYRKLNAIIENESFIQTKKWNEPENQDQQSRYHRRYILSEEHPDDDFIDLSALSRNIAQEMIFCGDLVSKKLREDIIKEWQDKQVGIQYDRLHFEP